MVSAYKYRYPIIALSVVLFVLIWYVYAAIVNNLDALSSPADTLNWFNKIASDPGINQMFVSGLEVTIVQIFEGFAIATIVGVPVGYLMGRYLVLDYLLDPWVNAWYSIPAVAFVPMTMNWFGSPDTATVVVAFLISVFMIIINVYTGVKNVSKSLVEPAMSFGANESQLTAKVILPASLPNLMVGLRLGISRSIDGVIIAEMIFSVSGFGYVIFDAVDKLELGLAVAAIIVLAIISIVLNEVMKYLTKRLIPWKESAAMSR